MMSGGQAAAGASSPFVALRAASTINHTCQVVSHCIIFMLLGAHPQAKEDENSPSWPI